MKALVTGSTGMIGSEFVRQLREAGYEVYGLSRNNSLARLKVIQDPFLLYSDILDEGSLRKHIKSIKPDLVIHMAAQAFNGFSWEVEDLTHETNYLGTLHLLRACKDYIPESKLVLACSSAEYGIVQIENQPIKEEIFLRPVTPYGVSKAGMELLGFQYFANYKMNIFLPRLFIHVGVGHPPATMIQNFARQVALISGNKSDAIVKTGPLDTKRDFIDVRDGVRGMLTLVDKGKPGEPVNICTQTAYSGREILDKLSKIAGVDFKIVSDDKLFRLSDEKLLLGDNSKLKELGWSQKYSIDETLKGVYEDWVKRINL